MVIRKNIHPCFKPTWYSWLESPWRPDDPNQQTSLRSPLNQAQLRPESNFIRFYKNKNVLNDTKHLFTSLPTYYFPNRGKLSYRRQLGQLSKITALGNVKFPELPWNVVVNNYILPSETKFLSLEGNYTFSLFHIYLYI